MLVFALVSFYVFMTIMKFEYIHMQVAVHVLTRFENSSIGQVCRMVLLFDSLAHNSFSSSKWLNKR